MCDEIRSELSEKATAQKALKQIEVCMGFLKSTGGDPRSPLFSYAIKILLFKEEEFNLWNTKALKKVQLQHVVEVWQVYEQFRLH